MRSDRHCQTKSKVFYVADIRGREWQQPLSARSGLSSNNSKLRGCDLMTLRVNDVVHGDRAVNRATVVQQKTHQPVQFEITEEIPEAVEAWITKAK